MNIEIAALCGLCKGTEGQVFDGSGGKKAYLCIN